MGSAALVTGGSAQLLGAPEDQKKVLPVNGGLEADVVICGGGLGGFAAALSLVREGRTVILTEETDWIGGQLTQQGVPLDEHRWIETTGAPKLYREFRNAIRGYYRRNYLLTEKAKRDPLLNPGGGAVSRLCHEPTVAVAVLTELLAPYVSAGRLTLLLNHRAVKSDVRSDLVKSVEVVDVFSKQRKILTATYFVDATELGDLLPLTGTEFVTGTESKRETGELHAPETGDPENVQSFTMCFALDHIDGENHIIKKPGDYKFWANYTPKLTPPWPGKLFELQYSSPRTLQPRKLAFIPNGGRVANTLNLWIYRKIIDRNTFTPGTYKRDITIVNWPINDYMLGNLIGNNSRFLKHVNASKQLGLSLLYWLQTEVERPDGGKGWPGLRLRNDVMGTADGFAKYPYVRESRRIRAKFTVLEQHVGLENRALVATGNENKNKAATFYDSVGIGYYPIDLHPSNKGNNYIDFASLPFQIPLGALLPVRMRNLLPANKNIGTTHVTNGCYRLHPVEWSIGEAVGLMIAFSINKDTTPQNIHKNRSLLKSFQDFIRERGIETEWPTTAE